MHGQDASKREIIVHDGENPFLHLSTVLGTAYDPDSLVKIKKDEGFGIEPMFFPLIINYPGRIDDSKLGFEAVQLGGIKMNKHVGDKHGLPCLFGNESNGH